MCSLPCYVWCRFAIHLRQCHARPHQGASSYLCHCCPPPIGDHLQSHRCSPCSLPQEGSTYHSTRPRDQPDSTREACHGYTPTHQQDHHIKCWALPSDQSTIPTHLVAIADTWSGHQRTPKERATITLVVRVTIWKHSSRSATWEQLKRRDDASHPGGRCWHLRVFCCCCCT